ncbi:MAG: permease [Phycisphaerales bacterium]|nr:permease [Phycisphaerales bacterium]
MGRREWVKLASLIALILGVSLLPVGAPEVQSAVGEGLRLTQWYAREHVILCLLPAFLIAGAIAAFVDQAAVMKYVGPGASKSAAYGVGATSGCILAVCSCTVLPLFAGIYRMGAGLGPAVSFLYAGPAINVLAVILTARVLGVEIGLARAFGAVGFSILIGLAMAAIFERRRNGAEEPPRTIITPDARPARPLRQLGALFGLMILVLIFANWGAAADASGFWHAIHAAKWLLTTSAAVLLGVVLWWWFCFPLLGVIGTGWLVGLLAFFFAHEPAIPFAAGTVALCFMMPRAGEQGREWWNQTWGYAKLITPLLIGGVFAAGALLGTPDSRGLIPPEWIERAVGGNDLGANLGASVVGAFMYFATLTEVPIVEGLIGSGMGKGPALALLLAGPALSLPNMLVIRSVIGTWKTAAYVTIVIVGSTLAGLLFGTLA